MPEPVGLAFKAYEIEELADVYFFRPLGMVCARAARSLGLTPTTVTIIGAGVGVVGGALLYDERLGLVAFALIILHSILDSSDGQLARMTGQVTEFGRMLDGVGGYLTHSAIFLAIGAGAVARGAALAPWTLSTLSTSPIAGPGVVVGVMLAAGAAAMVHAQMYDYHRTSYANAVIKGVAVAPAARGARGELSSRGIVRAYEHMQRALSAPHARVEATIAARAVSTASGAVRDEDRARYRSCFYWPVRGWNALGDNTRFYAIGALAWVHHPDWFFAFVLLPMNAMFALLWLWQARADRRFLAGL